MTGNAGCRAIGHDQAAADTMPEPTAAVVESAMRPPVPDKPAAGPSDRAATPDKSPNQSVSIAQRRPLSDRPRSGRRGILARVLVVIVASAATAWLSGFIWFMTVTGRPAPSPPHTDGIVALTGGAGRVELALRLLASGQASRLLLSGIGGGSELATLGRLAGVDTAGLTDRVTLGRYAASTRGNGVETAVWAAQNNIRSLIVVTAGYHMPRALAELRRTLPDVRLYPVPVLAVHAEAGDRGPGMRLQAEEYTKYLLTLSGLSAWFPRREPLPWPGLPGGVGT